MRVRLLIPFRDAVRGQVRDWPEDQCERIIDAGFAERYDETHQQMDQYMRLVKGGMDDDEAAAIVWGDDHDVEAEAPAPDPDHPTMRGADVPRGTSDGDV